MEEGSVAQASSNAPPDSREILERRPELSVMVVTAISDDQCFGIGVRFMLTSNNLGPLVSGTFRGEPASGGVLF